MHLPDTIEHLPTCDLVPYARNSRTHSAGQIAQVAASIQEFGFTNPILIRGAGIVAGHGRVLAAKSLGMASVPVIRLDHLTEAQARAYVIADNRLAELAGWDNDILADEIRDLQAEGFHLELTGFSDAEIAELLAEPPGPGKTDADATPPLQVEAVSKTGDVWVLGRHRVMCGDSTAAGDVQMLMGGGMATLLHADPPYGMGKQADGVAGDNIYRDELDQFQLSWWRTYRPHLVDNASAYIWGNAPDLWRLWWRAGLHSLERFEMRNHITWDKKCIAGMASPDLTQYPVATEHCIFFQFGNQFIGNVNTDEFPETWESLRGYMEGEATAAGIRPDDIKRLCGVGMFSHWFSRAQFTLIPEKHYATLAEAYPGCFVWPWREMKAEWTRVRGSARDVIHEKQGVSRSYFDNAHDIMRDVWEFPRVVGDDRHDHATPKPVVMMERIMKTSLPTGGVCVEPFGGSGSTLIGAEKTGRACYTMELQPKYCDVIVRRWQDYTGKTATHAATGAAFPA